MPGCIHDEHFCYAFGQVKHHVCAYTYMYVCAYHAVYGLCTSLIHNVLPIENEVISMVLPIDIKKLSLYRWFYHIMLYIYDCVYVCVET